MIEITWTEELPTTDGYYLFQIVHQPENKLMRRVDMESGPKLLYVVRREGLGMVSKETEMGLWSQLLGTEDLSGDWKAQYSNEPLDLGRDKASDY